MVDIDAVLRPSSGSIDELSHDFDNDQFSSFIDPTPTPSYFIDEVRASFILMKGTKLVSFEKIGLLFFGSFTDNWKFLGVARNF